MILYFRRSTNEGLDETLPHESAHPHPILYMDSRRADRIPTFPHGTLRTAASMRISGTLAGRMLVCCISLSASRPQGMPAGKGGHLGGARGCFGVGTSELSGGAAYQNHPVRAPSGSPQCTDCERSRVANAGCQRLAKRARASWLSPLCQELRR